MSELPRKTEIPPTAAPPHRSIWERLKHHKVVQWTLAYLALAYTLLHGAEMLAHSLGWSHGFLRAFTLVLILGIPVAVTIAWFHGARAQRRVSGPEMLLIAILLVLGGMYLWRDTRSQHAAGSAVGTAEEVAQGGGEHLGEPVPEAPATSIAVLAFSDLSVAGNQGYFSDGIAEEILNVLAHVKALKVASRTSSFQFRKSELGASAIARKLGVRSVLEGSVRNSGTTFRINAELVDGPTGFTRWAQTFDRPMDNIFAVQSEIAGAVVSALSSEVAAPAGAVGATSQPEHALPGGTTNVAAFDAYLRGRADYNLSEGESSDRRALAEFEAAIASDPRFAAAHAARSRALVVIANQYADAAHTAQTYDEAIKSAQTATALAPDLADAQSALAFALFQGRLDIRGAARPYQLSRALGEGEATVMGRYALYSADTGHAAEAEEAMTRALELDPLNPLVHRAMGSVLYAARRYADVIPHVNRALVLNPKLSGAHAALGNALLMLGRTREARDAYLAEPHKLVRFTGLAIAEKALGNEAAARKAMSGLVDELGDSALYQQAEVRAQWHEREGAMSLLERARALGDSGLVFARTDPLLDPVRDLPQFAQLLSQLGFD